ncbi:uncharacterized protein BO97DRAFT_229690 [Aspergillus homomorphus CBS 101889]|uniref:Uncharacterized protein n=1 Tax=Aspergillus homomorphus (strain CBS 101889) TaxID=1450537 RepID=A0A395HKE3_ASPHC|nr:hypothetical protein BO97DRAFT_229690 [Aspergillus homomorphus CBS 101889]RAL07979.1 hypothetical protein BO97DRAFT_229690 [Aspergillus homomorphus CBS 101889]
MKGKKKKKGPEAICNPSQLIVDSLCRSSPGLLNSCYAAKHQEPLEESNQQTKPPAAAAAAAAPPPPPPLLHSSFFLALPLIHRMLLAFFPFVPLYFAFFIVRLTPVPLFFCLCPAFPVK